MWNCAPRSSERIGDELNPQMWTQQLGQAQTQRLG